MHLPRPVVFLAVALSLVLAPPAGAALLVGDLVTPVAGGSHHEITVANTGPADVVLVSILDAPPGDPLIPGSLVAPDGFLALYDAPFGIIDLVEGARPFEVGGTVSGFTFDTAAPPDAASFSTFEAFTVAGDRLDGSIDRRVPGPPGLVALALGALVIMVRRRRSLTCAD